MIKPPLIEADEIRKLVRILVTNYYDQHMRNNNNNSSDDQSSTTQTTTTTTTTTSTANGTSTNTSGKLEIYGSLHITANNIRLLSCLIDEQLSLNDSSNNVYLNGSNQNGNTKTLTVSSAGLICNNGDNLQINNAGGTANPINTTTAGTSSASSTSSMSPPLSNYSIISSNELNQTKLSDKSKVKEVMSSNINTNRNKDDMDDLDDDNGEIDDDNEDDDDIMYPIKKFKAYHSYFNKRKMYGPNKIVKQTSVSPKPVSPPPPLVSQSSTQQHQQQSLQSSSTQAIETIEQQNIEAPASTGATPTPTPTPTPLLALPAPPSTAEIIASAAATQVAPPSGNLVDINNNNNNGKKHRSHHHRKQMRTHRRRQSINTDNNDIDSYYSYSSSCVSTSASSCRSTSRSLSRDSSHRHRRRHNSSVSSYDRSYENNNNNNNNNNTSNVNKIKIEARSSRSRSRSTNNSHSRSRSRSRSCSSSVSYNSAYNNNASKLMKLYKNYEKLQQQTATMSSLSFLAQTATLQQQQQLQQHHHHHHHHHHQQQLHQRQHHEMEMKIKSNESDIEQMPNSTIIAQQNAINIATNNGLLSLNEAKLVFNSDDNNDLNKQNSNSLISTNLNPNKLLCKKQQYIMMSSQSRQINSKNYNNIPTSSSISSSSNDINLSHNEDYKLSLSELKQYANANNHRLSPISDVEPNECANTNGISNKMNGTANGKDRIKSVSPLSSTSTASSSSLSQLSSKLQQSASSIVSPSSITAAVLAAAAASQHPHHLAAAAAAAAAKQQHHHQPHHQHHHSHQQNQHHLHNQHAQSVAALLADIQVSQQQQQQQHQQAAVALSHLASVNPAAAALQLSRYSSHSQNDLVAAVIAQQQQQQAQQQQQQQQQQNRAAAVAAALDSSTNSNNNTNPNNNNSNSTSNSNGQLYSRFSHISSNRRINSISSGDGEHTNNATISSSNNNNDDYVSKYNPVLQDRNEECVNKPNKERESNEKIRLSPGFDVFISTNDLNACNDDRGSATRLLRNLMDIFFDKSTLAKSSINGTGRITHTLDKHVISALFAYVKTRYPEVPHSQLTRAATDKCVQTRRNFRKKIKAAQSYFGMFPSIILARPQQLQGNENQV